MLKLHEEIDLPQIQQCEKGNGKWHIGLVPKSYDTQAQAQQQLDIAVQLGKRVHFGELPTKARLAFARVWRQTTLGRNAVYDNAAEGWGKDLAEDKRAFLLLAGQALLEEDEQDHDA